VLTAVVSEPKLWEPRIGNADRHFRDAGLPNDRRRLGDVLRTGRMPR